MADQPLRRSACRIVANEIRSRGTLTSEDGLVLTLLDLISERDHLRAALKRAVGCEYPDTCGGPLGELNPHCLACSRWNHYHAPEKLR